MPAEANTGVSGVHPVSVGELRVSTSSRLVKSSGQAISSTMPFVDGLTERMTISVSGSTVILITLGVNVETGSRVSASSSTRASAIS